MSEGSLSAFVAFLFSQGLAASTMQSYLAAVRHAQIALGLGDPVMSGMPQLQYVLKGAKRKLVGTPRRVRLPITPEILRLLRASWERLPSQADAVMLWAAASLCFFAFLRTGEAVVPHDTGFDPQIHLAYGDVRFDNASNPSWMAVSIKQSKCDQFGQGITLSVGSTGSDICPVAAMMGYVIQRGNNPGPLFQFTDGRPLTRDRFVSAVRRALAGAGIDPMSYA